MNSEPTPRTTQVIEIRGHLSRADAEVLQLELRRVARRHGVEVAAVRVERVEEC
jgi:hypothetical protein